MAVVLLKKKSLSEWTSLRMPTRDFWEYLQCKGRSDFLLENCCISLFMVSYEKEWIVWREWIPVKNWCRFLQLMWHLWHKQEMKYRSSNEPLPPVSCKFRVFIWGVRMPPTLIPAFCLPGFSFRGFVPVPVSWQSRRPRLSWMLLTMTAMVKLEQKVRWSTIIWKKNPQTLQSYTCSTILAQCFYRPLALVLTFSITVLSSI